MLSTPNLPEVPLHPMSASSVSAAPDEAAPLTTSKKGKGNDHGNWGNLAFDKAKIDIEAHPQRRKPELGRIRNISKQHATKSQPVERDFRTTAAPICRNYLRGRFRGSATSMACLA
uniref:Uncharacterized protein n=1 Tax=Mycena chlorophos TaxID=658473 RepID=A0ABQ0LEG4_MYCCL|nr:predicted protein [Mycena chlorophos]